MKGKVSKAFPFAYDGINVSHMAVGQDFPADGQKVASGTFEGLVAAGYVERVEGSELPPEEELNRRIIESIDKRLAAASDQDLKDIIARSGKPYSGNLVHARLVFAAKQQLQAEMEGATPVLGINPNSGVTEQPLSAPGAPTPPSAAAAVDRQKAEQEAAMKNAGENKATDQFGQPLSTGGTKHEIAVDDMTIAELKEHAEKKNIDLGDASKKADIVEKIRAAG